MKPEQLTAEELELIRQALAGIQQKNYTEPQRAKFNALQVKINRMSLAATAADLHERRIINESLFPG